MIWDNIKQVFSVVKAYFEGAFRTAKEAVELIWSAVTGFFQNIWNTIKGIFSAVKAVLSGDFQGAWDAIKGIVGGWTSYFSGIWQGIKNVFASVKSWFSNTFSAAFSAVKNIWSNISGFFSGLVSKIQSAVSNVKNILTKPFDAAKDAIVKVVDKIKSVFGGMKLSFPDIKMPHFSIKPSGWKIGDLLEGSIPKLGIEWYKEGGIMTKPTIFGMNGNSLMAGGEAGAEAILPIDKLEGYISDVVEKSVTVVNLQALADSIEELASRPIEMNINGRQFAMATASDGDNVNGLRSTFKSRGLAIE
jgi:phage-related protein